MIISKKVIVILFFVFTINLDNVYAIGDPVDFINNINYKIQKIITLRIVKKQKDGLLCQTINNILAYKKISRFVLGRYWNTMSMQQQNSFTQNYKRYLLNNYVKYLYSYSGAVHITQVERSEDNSNIYQVYSTTHNRNGFLVRTNYKLIRDENTFTIFDITINDMSISISHREKFYNEIAESNLNKLLANFAQEVANLNICN